LPPPPLPPPPSAEELATFRDVVADTDVLPLCAEVAHASTTCRDPASYIISNEIRQFVWLPFVANTGGAYVGVGADQGYALVAAARSRWAWFIDYDPQVVRVHRLVQALAKDSDSAATFLSAFSAKQAKETAARLRQLLADDPDQKAIVALFVRARERFEWNFRRQTGKLADPAFGWLNSEERFQYVKTMMQQGRILAMPGNLLTDKALPSIAAAARRLGEPVRVYYPSNAEEMWAFTPQYRKNVAALPFDERSVILRTLYNKGGTWDAQKKYWHYIVHHGPAAQTMMADPTVPGTRAMMRFRRPTAEPILSAIGFPESGGQSR
jgi:hypothetical protein